MKNLYESKHEAEMIDQLKSLEVSPPKDLWDNIDATLKAKRRRRIIIFTSWASAATIALLFTIGGIYGVRNRVETIAASNQESNTTSISNDKKKIAASPINSNRANISRGISNIEKNNVQRDSITSTNKPATIAPFETENNNLPKPIAAIHPKLEEVEVAAYNKIPNFNNIKSQSIAIVEPVEKKIKGDWYISASGFPVYSFHTAGAMDKPETQQQFGIVSWGVSVSARYALANRISIETGLAYSIWGQQEKNLYLVYSDSRNVEVYDNSEFKNSYGTLELSNSQYKVMNIGKVNLLSYDAVNESNFNKVDASQRFRYLEIPLLLSKGFYIKGINFYLKGGVSTGFLVLNFLDLKGSNIHLKGKTSGVDHFTTSALTSIGVSFPIANKVNLLIEPSFKLGLKPLSNLNGKTYPFSSCIKFGIEIPI